jgi:hypothetical protein
LLGSGEFVDKVLLDPGDDVLLASALGALSLVVLLLMGTPGFLGGKGILSGFLFNLLS